MEAGPGRSDFCAAPVRVLTPNNSEDSITDPLPSGTDYEFDESRCLFCNQTNPDLDQNLVHMSKLHGLHVDTTKLLVDVASLLAYLHLIISDCYECLYCGTQRNTQQAIQQHMTAKGHCKYDITARGAELREFYELSSSSAGVEVHERLAAMRFSDHPQFPSQARPIKSRSSKRPDRHSPNITGSRRDQAPPTRHIHTDAGPSSNTAETPSPSTTSEVSTRVLRHGQTLDNQLAQLRAGDQRSLAHLPASQQRALLATHYKQMESARRTEQMKRGSLESAGNKFGCLSKTRLIRQPPHFGHVQSLKH